MLARTKDVTDALALHIGWILPVKQLTEPEYGVQRRAQLVTHAREELALGVVGPVCFFLGFAQRFFDPGALVFRPFAIRDVLDHDQKMLRPAGAVSNDAARARSPTHFAILADITFFNIRTSPAIQHRVD